MLLRLPGQSIMQSGDPLFHHLMKSLKGRRGIAMVDIVFIIDFLDDPLTTPTLIDLLLDLIHEAHKLGAELSDGILVSDLPVTGDQHIDLQRLHKIERLEPLQRKGLLRLGMPMVQTLSPEKRTLLPGI